MEIHLGFHYAQDEATCQIWISQKWFDKSTSFFLPLKIWCFELRLALVSCRNLQFLWNGSHLKVSKKLSFSTEQCWSNFSLFNFLKKCFTSSGCSIHTTQSIKTKGYQWKGNVHTFYLIPKGTMCDHWSGHRDALKTGPILYKNFFLQRVDRFPYV